MTTQRAANKVPIEQQLLAVDQQFRDIRTWLAVDAEDVSANSQGHLVNCEVRDAGSCEWLIDNSTFRDWISPGEDKAYLWLRGPPGAGKSVACSRAIEHVVEQGSIVLYHFLTFDKPSVSIRVIALLVDQLLSHYKKTDTSVAAPVFSYTDHSTRNFATIKEAARILLQSSQATLMTPEKQRIFVFLDGLDEASRGEAANMIKFLINLKKEAEIDLRICISCRNSIDLSMDVSKYSVIDVGEYMEKDVRAYLSREFPQLRIFGSNIERELEHHCQVLMSHLLTGISPTMGRERSTTKV